MRLDKAKLEALAAMPDDQLWAEVIKIADSFGYALPRQTPAHADLEKMRDAVKTERINVSEALKIVSKYKK